MRALVLLLVAWAAAPVTALRAQPVWYVDADATGANSGASWDDAFTDLQDALAAAEAGAEVWVAEGTYHPTSGTERSASFALPDGVRLFGGFDGTEAERHDRDWAQHETVLSGDVGAEGQAGDNSFHVVTITSGLEETTLDGFTVRDAYADGPAPDDRQGGGIVVSGGRPRIANCRFVHNASLGIGSALYVDGASPHDVANVAFVANDAGVGGTVAFTGGSRTNLSAATLTGNVGGGIVAQASSFPQLSNLIIWDNGAAPAIDAADGAVVFVRHAIVEGGYTGTEVEDLDPQFVRPPLTEGPDDLGDLRLLDTSPGHALGDAAFLPADTADDDGDGDTAEALPLDLLHEARVQDAALTIGAYEEAVTDVPPPPDCPAGTVIHVRQNAAPGGNGGMWATAFPDLQEALARARLCELVEVWVAEGTYTPGTVRDTSFVLFDDLRLLGGFAGTETSAEEADPDANLTELSGEIGGPETTDNVYTVLTAVGVEGVHVDGFIILRGLAPTNGSGGLVMTEAEVTVSRSRFVENYGATASAITATDGISLTLTEVDFLGNIPGTNAPGDLTAQYTPVTVDQCLFESTEGHAIDHYASTLDVTDSSFRRAAGASWGGGISKGQGSLRVAGSQFIGLRAAEGAGIYADRADTVIETSVFEENEATSHAGAVYCAGDTESAPPDCSVSESTFRGNESEGLAGALYCTDARCHIEGSSFENNQSTGPGGALFMERVATNSHIITSSFDGNKASSGGAIYYATKNAVWFDPIDIDTRLVDVVLKNNTATAEGGGLWSFTCSTIPLRLVNLEVVGNAALRGGGLYVTGGHFVSSGPLSNNCTGETDVVNALLVANAASEGAAAYVSETNDSTIGHGLTMTNATLAGNSAGQGGGVYNDGAYASFRNGILWGNAGGETAGDNVALSYAIVDGFEEPNPTVLDEDPLFLRDPFTNGGDDLGDLHLQDASPAIDFGVHSLLPPDTFDLDDDGDTDEPLPVDLDGSPRAVRGVPDLGAYENLVGVAAEPPGSLPVTFRLVGAYPNPFNPATRIAFDLPEAAEVELAVFDLLGRRVAEVGPTLLVAGAGRSLELRGRGLASGLYLYRLTARMGENTRTATGRVTLLK